MKTRSGGFRGWRGLVHGVCGVVLLTGLQIGVTPVLTGCSRENPQTDQSEAVIEKAGNDFVKAVIEDHGDREAAFADLVACMKTVEPTFSGPQVEQFRQAVFAGVDVLQTFYARSEKTGEAYGTLAAKLFDEDSGMFIMDPSSRRKDAVRDLERIVVEMEDAWLALPERTRRALADCGPELRESILSGLREGNETAERLIAIWKQQLGILKELMRLTERAERSEEDSARIQSLCSTFDELTEKMSAIADEDDK